MKIRSDFVTNSSSSSFIVSKSGLTFDQIEAIENPYVSVWRYKDKFIKVPDAEFTSGLGHRPEREDGLIVIPCWADTVEEYLNEAGAWGVKYYNDEHIEMTTYMDNFDIVDLVRCLNIPPENCKQEWNS